MSRQLRLFDGKPVEHFAVALGSYELDDDDVEEFGMDAMVVMVVVASVEGAAYKRGTDGSMKRTGTTKVHNLRVATGEMRDTLIRAFHLDVSDQMELTMPATPPAPPHSAQVDTTTGELTTGEMLGDDSRHEAGLRLGADGWEDTQVPVPASSATPPPAPRMGKGPAADFFGEEPPGDVIRSAG